GRPDPSARGVAPEGALAVSEMLGERARSPLVPEDAYPVDGALENRVRHRRHLGGLDEEDRVLLGGELIHDLALGELSLDGLLVVGFDDDPWRPLHSRTSFPRRISMSDGPEARLRLR